MRIGIVPASTRLTGGVYQYGMTMLAALHDLAKETGDEVVVFLHDPRHPDFVSEGRTTFEIKPLEPSRLKQLAWKAAQRPWIFGTAMWLYHQWQGKVIRSDPDTIRYQPRTTAWLRKNGVDLMIYPYPNTLSFEARLPYIMAVHDLQHRIQPEFPEVSDRGEQEWREYLFRNGSRKAVLLLADSETGRDDILRYYGEYGITPDRIKILPFLPAGYLEDEVSEQDRIGVRKKYQCPKDFLFYPAQFWPHKNHLRIVQALGLLKKKHGLKIPVLFCGSSSGKIQGRTFRQVMSLASESGLQSEIRHLGYVPDDDMKALYAEATALVMPTFFGPTNIPVLEAWSLGCPVLTSDIRGIREQTGQAALLVEPSSVEDMAEGIYRLWTDDRLRRSLAEEGRKRLESYTPDDYRKQLREILQDAKTRIGKLRNHSSSE